MRAERVGTSNLVELRVTTKPGADGDAALVGRWTTRTKRCSPPPPTTAEARVGTAKQRYEKALADRDEETSRTGLLLPIEAYRAKASEVTQLRVALATSSEVNRDAVQATLQQAISDLRQIGESVNAYESLADSVTRTRSDFGAAQQAVEDGQTRLAAASAPESITIAAPTKHRRAPTLVRSASPPSCSGWRSASGWSSSSACCAAGGPKVRPRQRTRARRRPRVGGRSTGAGKPVTTAPIGCCTSGGPAAAAARCSPTSSARCPASRPSARSASSGSGASSRTACAGAVTTSPTARSGPTSWTRPGSGLQRPRAAARRQTLPERTRMRTLPQHLPAGPAATGPTRCRPSSLGCTTRSPSQGPTWSSTRPSCRRTPEIGDPGIGLQMAHFVRDPRAAAYSWQRKKLQPDLGPGRSWSDAAPGRARCSGRSGTAASRCSRAPANAYARRPTRSSWPTRARRQSLLDTSPWTATWTSVFAGPDTVRLSMNHTVAGNPSRHQQGLVALVVDSEWRDRCRRPTAAPWPS